MAGMIVTYTKISNTAIIKNTLKNERTVFSYIYTMVCDRRTPARGFIK